MRETKFIEKNQEKWREYEEELQKKYQNPDKLSEIFIHVTDDLSYARTFYRNRSVRVYLNGLAQKIFINLYKHKRAPLKRFFLFWKEELPWIIYTCRKDFLLSLLIFLGAFLIGALSTAMDPDFPRIILGDNYVDMTIENIRKGDPMAVYKQQGQFGMSVGITFNNIFVAFLTFVMGILAAVGTIGILIKNGVMVGAFQYFFYEQGVFLESFLTIWMHGTLEISAIIIAGAAGVIMGKGLIFPGTLTRIKSFQQSARKGLKIMLGLIPIFIIAGFIEGYITRHTEVSDWIRGFFILTCLTSILWYFVWYPKKKSALGFNIISPDYFLQADSVQEIDFGKIKSVGALFADAVLFYKNQFWKIMSLSFFSGIAYVIFVYFFQQADHFYELFYFQGFPGNLKQFFVHPKIKALPFFLIPSLTAIFIFHNRQLLQKADRLFPESGAIGRFSLFLRALIPVTLMLTLLQVGQGYTPILVLLLFPVILLWLQVMQKEGLWYIHGLIRTFHLLGAAYVKLVLLSTVFFLFFFFTLAALFSPLLGEHTSLVYFIMDIINWNLPPGDHDGKNILHMLMLFAYIFAILLLYPLLLFCIQLYAFSQIEIKTAARLREKIQQIGNRKQIKGLAIEEENRQSL